MRLVIPLASTLFASAPAYAAYNLVKEYQGTNFFDGWTFYGNYDNLTNGDVTYVDQVNATSSKLAYVNDAGNAIIKVDNTSFVPYNYKRNSVRIETNDYFPIGTVLVFDVTHLPFGCSVWPGYWTSGINWPSGGEIDILEGINLMSANQMAIHTSSGCTLSGTDCSLTSGCAVGEKAENSYGSAFASAGGGVWATQFDTDGINIWFWSRSNVPASVTGATNSIDVTGWGTPSAAFPSSTCDINKFFTPQKMILDITLCGDWAGAAPIYQSTCGGDGTATACYLDNVINNGTNYGDAYFEIAYIKAFSTQQETFVANVSNNSTILSSVAATSTGSTPSSTGHTSGNTPSGTNGDGNGAVGPATAFVGIVATIVAAFSWVLV